MGTVSQPGSNNTTAVDEIYNSVKSPTEGEKVLEILHKTGFLASMPDVANLSENYKSYLDWSDKT